MGTLFLSSSGRRLPIVVSLLAHGLIVVAASGGSGGLAPPAPINEFAIDLDVPIPPPLVEPPPAPPEVHPPAERAPTYTTHPSLDPRQAAAAPAVRVAPTSTLPRFSLVLGAAEPSAGGITGRAGGPGPGLGAATRAPADEAEVEEPAVTVPAQLTSSGRPEYPPSARAAGLEADVQLEIVVDSGGRVVESHLLRGAGHGFDEAALKAIRTYRFTPAQHDGVAVRVRMRWTVAFRLE
jgi:protein TonB